MKEPKSRRTGSSAKTTKATKAADTVKTADTAKASRSSASTRATRAASAAKPATVTQLATATRGTTGRRAASVADYRKEIDGLRREVDKLRAQLAASHRQSGMANGGPSVREDAHPWLRIGATVGMTFVLGKLMQALRVPTAAAVAVPMITAEVNRRLL